MTACAQPSGTVDISGDCNDADSAINPSVEPYDGIDNDCDTDIDEDFTFNDYYVDADGDGFGDPNLIENACQQPLGTVLNNLDCNDSEFSINPAMDEICDEFDVDEDCNGFADDNDTGIDPQYLVTSYVDSDGDGYGDPNGTPALSCEPPSGFVGNNTDCNDGNEDINPDALEVCDDFDTDENCNGLADDADSTISPSQLIEWAPDLDLDGFGSDSATTIFQCEDPSTSTVYVGNQLIVTTTMSTLTPMPLKFVTH